VIEYARNHGCICVKQSTAGRYGTAGWPDYLICIPGGAVIWFEFKRPGQKMTPLQARRAEELEQIEHVHEVVDDAVRGKHLIDRYLAVWGQP
jgi:hypothetical protein